MRNLLAFLAAVCLTVAGSGWYLGWYTVESAPAPQGKRSVNIEINTVKIGEDIKRGSEKLQDLLKDSKETTKAAEKKKPSADKESRVGARDDGGSELSEHH
jgi:predicted small secreted protein